jgi:hypothetical protein
MIDNNPLRFGSPGTFGISICNVSRRPGSGYSETVFLQLGWQDWWQEALAFDRSFVGLHIKGREPDKTRCSVCQESSPILMWVNNLALHPKRQVMRG